MSDDCPVVIYYSTDVKPERFASVTCRNCGYSYSEHEAEQSVLAPPGMVYGIDPAQIHHEPRADA